MPSTLMWGNAFASSIAAQYAPFGRHGGPPASVVGMEVGDGMVTFVPVHVNHYAVKALIRGMG